MKKLFGLILVLSGCFSYMQAQSSNDAENILNKATAKIQSSKGINISFSLTQKDKSKNIVSASKGILKIKGLKYYLKQGDNEIFCDGTKTWNYDGQNEVTVSKVENDDELSPQQIFTGFNKSDYDIKLISSSAINYQIQLTPVDKRKNFKQVMLYINKSTNLVTKASVTDKINAITEITFSNISLNTDLSDSQFVFDTAKHPGVEVVNQ